MVQAGVDKEIKLFTTGFDGGEENNFGSKGTQTFQQNMVSAAESITYPLVLILNKVNGVAFADMPETAERIITSQFCINSDEDMYMSWFVSTDAFPFAARYADVLGAVYTGQFT